MEQGAPKTCPTCGLLSPPSALRCDCGFDFRAQKGGDPSVTLRGLSGWLFLVGIGLCVSLIRSIGNFATLVKDFNQAWPLLTTPGSAFYHWLGAPLLASELLSGVVLLGWTGVLVYLFFSKKRGFPGSVIAFLVVSLVWTVVDLAGALMIPAVRELDHAVQIRAIAQGVIGAAIWIPYFTRSKRVRATFVQ